MNRHSILRTVRLTLAAAILCASAFAPNHVSAAGGKPAPGPTPEPLPTGGAGGGGGGGGGGKPVTKPSPPPVTPIVTAALTFTAAAQINGVVPFCTGSYRIDPYYPTLSLMTVSVQVSSMNEPDGTSLYISVNGAGGTLYPVAGGILSILSQGGTCTLSAYVTPGTTIQSVVISDATGAVIAAGN